MLKRHGAWLVLSIVFLTLGGCGTNPDATYLYQLEKLFYRAERETRAVTIGPAGADEAERLHLAELYGEVAEYYHANREKFTGGANSETVRSAVALAVQSSLRMGAVLVGTTQVDRAQEIYRRIAAEYPEAQEYHFITRHELARLFERRRMWDSAVLWYHGLMYTQRPPADTLSGYDLDWLRIPLHIAELYDQLDARESAAAWLDTGLVFYRRVIEQYPTGTAKVLAMTNLATVHRLRGDFRAAIAVLRTATDSSGRILPQAQVEIGDLFYDGLKMPDSALTAFMGLVADHPDAPAATIAQTKIAAIYIDLQKYQQARELLRPLKEAYEKKGQIVAGVLLLLGRSYEAEGAWDRALNEYSWLVENFPTLRQSMDVYLHVIDRMAAQNNLPVARQWQKQAREQFERLVRENPGTELAAAAQAGLARSYLLLQEWEEAAREYQTLIDTYPPPLAQPQTYLELSTVYADKLGDRARGAAVLEKLLTDYPDFRKKQEVKNRIDQWRSNLSEERILRNYSV